MARCVVEGDLRAQGLDSESESESDSGSEAGSEAQWGRNAEAFGEPVLLRTDWESADEEIEVFGASAPSQSKLIPVPSQLLNEPNASPAKIAEEVAAAAVRVGAPQPTIQMPEFAGADDDEFAVLEAESDVNQQAIILALGKSKEVAPADADVVDFTAELQALKEQEEEAQFEWAEAPTIQGVDEPLVLGQRSIASSGASLQVDAQKALGDILDIYGNGMGDQEVLLLDLPDQQRVASDQAALTAKGPLAAIEEDVDEDDDENDERGTAAAPVKAVPLEGEGLDGQAVVFAEVSSAFDEWEAEARQHREEAQASAAPTAAAVAATPVAAVSLITYSSALVRIRAMDLSRLVPLINPVERVPSKSWMGMFSKPAELAPALAPELALPFLVAQLDYNPSDPLHLSMLCSVYEQLVGQALPLAVDEKWERLGFQGRDPRTDLNRSMKLLSVLQMLAFLEMNPFLCKQLFDMSLCSTPALPRAAQEQVDQSWPFMCVAVMFTKEALQALRSGRLYRRCHAHGSVLEVLHLFYQACFFDFGLRLLVDPDKHHAVHLAGLRQDCADNPTRLFKRFVNSGMTLIMPDQVLQLVQPSSARERFDDIASAAVLDSAEAASEVQADATIVLASSHPRRANRFLAP